LSRALPAPLVARSECAVGLPQVDGVVDVDNYSSDFRVAVCS
jgi:hypothetical protein